MFRLKIQAILGPISPSISNSKQKLKQEGVILGNSYFCCEEDEEIVFKGVERCLLGTSKTYTLGSIIWLRYLRVVGEGMNNRRMIMKDYHINIFYSEEDEGYIADIPDLKYCSAFGDTS